MSNFSTRVRHYNMFIPNCVALRVMSEAFGIEFQCVEHIGHFLGTNPQCREWFNRHAPGDVYAGPFIDDFETSTDLAQEKTDAA